MVNCDCDLALAETPRLGDRETPDTGEFRSRLGTPAELLPVFGASELLPVKRDSLQVLLELA